MLLAATSFGGGAGYLFLRFAAEGGVTALDTLRTLLVVVSAFWLVWGSGAAILGFFTRGGRQQLSDPVPPRGMTAILVPIYNEDPVATFARIAAMNRQLVQLGVAERFHVAVLSDTQTLEGATQEAVWFEQLLHEPMSAGRIFYRRRERNVGRKAGNIEDFIARSGGAYDYAVILDADSLMEGRTILSLACRMDEQPDLGLLQTIPKIINARTLFGRSMQFASWYLSPTFARGAALMQGREGPYWGHNAIVRVKAFAASCGLPELSGKPPFGGHILSHDYVEAALLSRAGWTVNVAPELGGSYEEGPENLLEYAKRDRRWCQGNLQHWRLINAPGLKFWSRFTFIQGIMAYMASPLWLLLLVTSIAAAVLPEQGRVHPGFAPSPQSMWVLGAGVAAILVLPKFLILLRGLLGGSNRRFGGTRNAALSVIGEIVFSTVLAPIMLLFQTRAVVQVLFGLDGGWPATTRGQNWVAPRDALRASWWIVALGLATLVATAVFAPQITAWVIPAALPAVLAPVLISWSSKPPRNDTLPVLFRTDPELSPSPVIVEYQSIVAIWTNRVEQSAELAIATRAPVYVPA
jgi:membrane glycosyltransferase